MVNESRSTAVDAESSRERGLDDPRHGHHRKEEVLMYS